MHVCKKQYSYKISHVFFAKEMDQAFYVNARKAPSFLTSKIRWLMCYAVHASTHDSTVTHGNSSHSVYIIKHHRYKSVVGD
jgi:hypothetical protein